MLQFTKLVSQKRLFQLKELIESFLHLVKLRNMLLGVLDSLFLEFVQLSKQSEGVQYFMVIFLKLATG